MFTLILGIFLLATLIYGITLLKTYHQISAKELKRQARSGDKLAGSLYRVVGFGLSLDIILWFVVGLSGGALFTLLASVMPHWSAVVLISILVWCGFAWLPKSNSSYPSRQIANYSAKPLQFIIDLLYPILSKIEKIIIKNRPITIHTGLYEKQDLIDLLSQQKGQLDNRISKDDLRVAINALTYSSKLICDVMTPKRVMKTVSAKDAIGPILMEELHKSGHSRFPVYQDGKEDFVGVLYLRDLIRSREGGLVKDFMMKQVYYVHDESSIGEVLQAFIKTHRHLFLVVNSFEEVVGLVTLEDVLEQIIGKPILDEFDEYESMRAVAEKQAQKDHKTYLEPTAKAQND